MIKESTLDGSIPQNKTHANKSIAVIFIWQAQKNNRENGPGSTTGKWDSRRFLQPSAFGLVVADHDDGQSASCDATFDNIKVAVFVLA